MRHLTRAALVLSALVVTAGTAWAEPKPGGTLIIATSSNPRHLNPAVQSGTPAGIPGTQIFAAPLRFDGEWNPQPYLAESWVWGDNGLSLTLTLVEGATPESEREALTVRDACVLDAYVVDVGERLDRVLVDMARRHIGSAVVVKNDKLAGIFTATDACQAFGEFLRELFPEPDPDQAA